jgi:hypothetical protein
VIDSEEWDMELGRVEEETVTGALPCSFFWIFKLNAYITLYIFYSFCEEIMACGTKEKG